MGHSREDRTKRRNIRQAPVLPEDEVPRQTGLKRNKPKHVHKFERTEHEIVVRRYSAGERRFVPITTYGMVCRGCGFKRGHGGWYY